MQEEKHAAKEKLERKKSGLEREVSRNVLNKQI